MSEWKRDWTDKQKELYHRALAAGHYLYRNVRDGYFILYDQCPDEQGVSVVNEKFAGQVGPLEKYIEKLEADPDVWKKALWRDHKGRLILIHTMSDRWLKNIKRKFGRNVLTEPIYREIKRRK